MSDTLSGRPALMAQQIRHLEQVDSQRRGLLANVSHGLRMPLTLMQGTSSRRRCAATSP